MEVEKLYTPQEAADLTGHKVRTIRDYAYQGKIRSLKRNNRIMFTAEMINEYNAKAKERLK